MKMQLVSSGAHNLYILDDQNQPVIAESLEQWADQMKDIERRTVDYWMLPGKWEVTTVFIGINKEIIGERKPRLFETLVRPIGQSILLNAEIKASYDCWEDAEKGHQMIVESLVRIES